MRNRLLVAALLVVAVVGLIAGCRWAAEGGATATGATLQAVGAAVAAVPTPFTIIAGSVLGVIGTVMTAIGAGLEKPVIAKAGAGIGVAGLASVVAGIVSLPTQAVLVAPAEAEPEAPVMVTGTAVPE